MGETTEDNVFALDAFENDFIADESEMDVEGVVGEELVDDLVLIEGPLWAAYLYARYTKSGRKLSQRIVGWSLSMARAKFPQIFERVKRSEKASKIFKAVFRSGAGAHGVSGITLSKQYKNLSNSAKTTKILRKSSWFAKAAGKLNTFGAKIASKTPAFMKRGFGKVVGRKLLSGLFIVADIAITIEVVRDLTDWMNHEESSTGHVPSAAAIDEKVSQLAEVYDFTADLEAAIGDYDGNMTDVVSSRIRRGIPRIVSGDIGDRESRIEELALVLDSLPRLFDDNATAAQVGRLMMGVGACIVNDIPYSVLSKKVLDIDPDDNLQYFGEGREAFEISRSIHESLAVEFVDHCLLTPMNAPDFQAADANDTIYPSFVKQGFKIRDIRLES